jgi:hypothetical protein
MVVNIRGRSIKEPSVIWVFTTHSGTILGSSVVMRKKLFTPFVKFGMLSENRSMNIDPLDLLSKAEYGDARELVSAQCQSPSRGSGIKTLYFIKTDNPNNYILSRDPSGTEFVMFAQMNESVKAFHVFNRRPTEPDFKVDRPDFKLAWDEDKSIWYVTMCADSLICDKCLYRSRNVSLFDERPTILSICQGTQRSEKGDNHWFFMDIEGVSTEFGNRVVECRRCREDSGGDDSIFNPRSSFNLLPDSPARSGRVLPAFHLKSVIPSLTKSGDLSIRFMTRDRTVLPSARNMQITSHNTERPSEIVFQLIKVSAMKFNIDFRSPLAPIQAFCIALSTHYWK